jgi:glycogen operon protein
MACVSTHDLPPLAGWGEGKDIAERRALGLAPDDAEVVRDAERAALVDALSHEGLDRSGGIVAPAHAFVARAPSALMLVQADDLAGATVGVNLPGTDMERPNWRRRLAPDVSALLETETATSVLDAVRAARPPD